MKPPSYIRVKELITNEESKTFSDEFIFTLKQYSIGDSLPPSISAIKDETLPEEGYILDTRGESILIKYKDSRGLLWAVKTLYLLTDIKNNSIPSVFIKDWPDVSRRAFMLDISRDKVPSLSTVFEMIDILSLLKFNEIQLYIEHTFAYRGHEVVWKNASPYTPADIMRLQQYAAARGIELVPNQNSLGHMERWLKHNKYRHLAEKPDGFTDPWGVFRADPSTLCPTDTDSLVLVKDLYSQLLPLFSSPLCNVGGDEPFEFGSGRSKAECDKRGKSSVYLDYILKLRDIAASYGKRIQVWGDFILEHNEILDKLPHDVIVADWWYDAGYKFSEHAQSFRERDIPFYLCVGTSSWLSLGGRWENARQNILEAIEAARQSSPLGLMITDWGDQGHFQQLAVSMPMLALFGIAAWDNSVTDDVALWENAGLDFTASHIYGDTELSVAAYKLANLPIIKEAGWHNTSPLAVILIDHFYPYYRSSYSQFRNRSFSPEKDIIAEARESAVSASPSLWKDELLFTCDILDFASDYAEAFLATPDFKASQIEPSVSSELFTRLERLVFDYETRWLMRNRMGGLVDSVGKLKGIFDLLVR
ncbi:family 20 glycosylhydrolase [Spirochaetia bacterium 38H-sp]|uniref:Family 20 glycosylhydrolase n=1 Tax=Rarispira pelagica TaxID=3141764 RepID=A0ABU9UAY3_9SPIR